MKRSSAGTRETASRRLDRIAAAREAWQAAAEAYRQAAEPWDLAQAYLRLGDSYASGSVMDASKRWLFLDYYEQAMTALLQAYETDVRKEAAPVREVEQIRSLFRERAPVPRAATSRAP